MSNDELAGLDFSGVDLPQADSEELSGLDFTGVDVGQADDELAGLDFSGVDTPTDRTWGEAAEDLGRSAAAGANSMVGGVAWLAEKASKLPHPANAATHLAKAAGIDFNPIADAAEAVQEQTKSGEEHWNAGLSDHAQANQQRLAEAEGVGETLGVLAKNPEMIADLSAGSLAYLVPGAAASRLGYLAKGAKGAAAANILSGGLLEGADAAKAAEEFVANATPEKLAESDSYRQLVSETGSHEQALNTLVDQAGLRAFLPAAAIGTIAGKFGAGKLEADFLTQGIKDTAVKTVSKEVGTEAVQEAGNQIGQNIGAQTIDDDVGYFDDVGKAATVGGVMGGVHAGAMQALGKEPQQEVEEDPVLALPAPEAINVEPTGPEQIRRTNANNGLEESVPWPENTERIIEADKPAPTAREVKTRIPEPDGDVDVDALEKVVQQDQIDAAWEQQQESKTVAQPDDVQLAMDEAAPNKLGYLAKKVEGKSDKLRNKINTANTPENSAMGDALQDAMDAAGTDPKSIGDASFLEKSTEASYKIQPEKPKKPSWRSVNPGRDDLMTAIAKLGGLDSEQASAEGVDLKDNHRRGVHSPFRKNGRSLDDLAESLQQYGFDTPDSKSLLDQVLRSTAGQERIFTPEGQYQYTAQQEAEEQALRALDPDDETDIGAGYDSEVDAVEGVTEQERVLAHFVDNAIEAGVAPNVVREVLNMDYDTPYQYAGALLAKTNEVGNAEANQSRQGDSTSREDSRAQGSEIPGFDQTEADYAAAEKELNEFFGTASENKADSSTNVRDKAIKAAEEAKKVKAPATEQPLDNPSKSPEENPGDIPVTAEVENTVKESLDIAANEAATSPTNNLPEPTEAQIEADNYKKGKTRLHGLEISIENPAGSVRRGKDPDGKEWESPIHYHYGDIKRTKGADGDAVDVFIGPNPDSEKVFVIDQVNKDGSFDEHKVMMGFDNKGKAIAGYKKNYEKGWKVGPITSLTIDEFKAWLKDGDTTRPAGDQLLSQEEVVYPLDAVKAAYAHTSHSPARAARSHKESFEKAVDQQREVAQAKVATEEQQQALEAELRAFKRDYIAEESKQLNARSGAVSAHVAGGSNFNRKQAASRNNALDRSIDDFSRWLDTQKDRVLLAVLGARTDRQKNEDREQARTKAQKSQLNRQLRDLAESIVTMSEPGWDKASFRPKALQALAKAAELDRQETIKALQKIEAAMATKGGLEKVVGTRSTLWKEIAALKSSSPTEARIEADSYKKGKTRLHGLETSIENPAGRVEDFGEKMAGARKDEGVSQDALSILEQDMELSEIAAQPLSKLWPKSINEAITDPFMKSLAHVAREAIPAKPRTAHKKNRWAEQVQTLRGMVPMLMRLHISGEMDQKGIEQRLSSIPGINDKVLLLEGLAPEKWSRVGGVRSASGQYRDPKSGEMVPGSWVNVEIDGRQQTVYGVDGPREAITEVNKLLENEKPAPNESRKFEIRGRKGGYYINRKGDREYRALKSFTDLAEARKFKNENTQELNEEWEKVKQRDNVRKSDVRTKINQARKGIDRRSGKDVTPEMFTNDFGFRGVEFGNWVKQGKGGRDRQGLLNDSYDGLHDLADVLGIPPKAISLNGELGLAFGSRGRGGLAAAHYEPGNIVINLTKTKGAGSLAHEWFHALDHYFGRKREEEQSGRDIYITHKPEPLYRKKQGHYGKLLTRGELDRYRRISDSNQFDPSNWEKDPNHPKGVRPEVEEKFANLVNLLADSELKTRSFANDKGSEDGYWSRMLEMAARSFENYVITSLKDQGASNDFLANVVSEENWSKDPDRYPYLLDSEMEPVKKAFDELFSTIETKQTEKGVMLFSKSARLPDNASPEGVPFKKAEHNVRQFLKKYSGANDGLQVRVWKSQAEWLGEDWRDYGRLKGAYDTDANTVHLVSSNLSTIKELNEILQHEILVHKGLGFLSPNLQEQLINTILENAPKSPELKSSWEEITSTYSGLSPKIQAEELLASLAERNLSKFDKALNTIIMAIKRALQSIGWLKPGLTRQDLIAEIYRFAEAFEAGKVAPLRKIDDHGNLLYSTDSDRTDASEVIPVIETDESAPKNFAEAKKLAKERFQGKTFYNPRLHASISVSRNSIDKALSGSAKKNRSAADHLAALPALDQLLENAIPVSSRPANKNQDNIGEIIRMVAPMRIDGRLERVKITVKRFEDGDRRDKFYTYEVQAIESDASARSNGHSGKADVNPSMTEASEVTIADLIEGMEPDEGGFNLLSGQNGAKYLMARDRSQASEADPLNKLGLNPKEKQSVKSKIENVINKNWADILDRGYEGTFDGLVGIMRAEQREGVGIGAGDFSGSGYVSARLATGIADTMHGILHYGAPKWGDGVVQHKAGTRGLLEIFADLGPDLNNWLGWMAGNRAQELMAEGRENNLTQNDIDSLLGLAKGKKKKFLAAHREYSAMNSAMLDLAQEAGLLNPESRSNWESEWYVPFYRQDESDLGLVAPRTKKGLSHQTAGIKQLKGGKTATNDLLENIITNWMKLADSSMKNMALMKTVDSLKDTDYINAAEELEPSAANKKGSQDIVRVQRGGKDEYYQVTDEPLLRALTHIGRGANDSIVMKSARWFKRLLTMGVTSSPDFILRNFVRDAVHAWAINPDGFTIGKDSITGIRDALNEDSDYRAMMFAGASFQGGYVHGTDPEASAQIIRRALNKKGLSGSKADSHLESLVNTKDKSWALLKSGWEKYREYGDKLENANRLATFKNALESGKPLAQAIYESKDLMDYSLQGNWAAVNILTDVVPFLNARLQGLSKLGRAANSNPVPVAIALSKIAAASLLLAMVNADEEAYQALPDWEKDAYWHVFIDGKHFRIPKPFEIGIIAGTMPERMWHAWVADKQPDEKVLWSFKHGLLETLSFNPTPQALLPLKEIQQNRSDHFDSPIESMTDQRKLPEDRHNARTSDTAVWLGEATGTSPKKIEHLWKGYTGTMGAYALAAADMLVGYGKPNQGEIGPRDIPVLKSFYRGDGPAYQTQYATDLYKRLSEVSQLYGSLKDMEGDERREFIAEHKPKLKHRKFLKSVNKQVRSLKKQRDRYIKDPDMKPKVKQAKLDTIQKRINALVKRASEKTEEAF